MILRVATFAIAFTAVLGAVAGLAFAEDRPPGQGASAAHAQYLPDGRLTRPAAYRDWPFLTASIDMNYSDGGMAMDHHMIDNVFVDPDGLRAFRATGLWPDGTVFVKENRVGVSKGSINRSGQFQDEAIASMEVHIKDSVRFKTGWGFFAFGDAQPAPLIPVVAACYSCHQAHGAVDTSFVQFYPTLIGVAKAKGTLSPGYLADLAAEAGDAKR